MFCDQRLPKKEQLRYPKFVQIRNIAENYIIFKIIIRIINS